MERERSAGDAFTRGANRDAFEGLQMGDETRTRIADNRRGGELEKAQMANQQREQRSRDIVQMTSDIIREHEAQRAQRPWWHLRSEKPSPEKVAELAIQRVEERNRAALAAVDRLTAQRERAILDAARVRDVRSDKERVAIAAMRAQLKRDRDVTRGHERER